MELAEMLLAVACGGAIGLPLGLLGAGGSLLAVPLLVYVFGRDVPTATGTALLIVGVTAAAAAAGHHGAGRVQIRTGLVFGGLGALGALVGARVNPLLPGPVVLLLLALVMLGTAASMVRTARRDRGGPVDTTPPSLVAVGVAALTVGGLSGLLGVGAGFLIVPALMLVAHLPAHEAVGTSLLVIALQALGGVLGYLAGGWVDWPLAALFLVGGMVGAWLGKQLAGRLSGSHLSQVFAGAIVVVAVFLIQRNAGLLFGGL
jgi:uncharacterized membrane protein YfcA